MKRKGGKKERDVYGEEFQRNEILINQKHDLKAKLLLYNPNCKIRIYIYRPRIETRRNYFCFKKKKKKKKKEKKINNNNKEA